MAKQTSHVKVQADRWPVTSNKDADYIVTVICVASFKGKPTEKQIAEVCSQGAETLHNYEVVQ